MEINIYQNLLRLLVITPFILLFIKDRSSETLRSLFIFYAVYLIYSIVLFLPYYEMFRFVDGNVGWNSKILAVILAIISYVLLKGHLKDNDFITFKQDMTRYKMVLMVSFVMLILSVLMGFALIEKASFNAEILAYQLTLPGIDEEIFFRGIILGLLMTALKDKTKYLGNPSLLITAILFGLVHSLNMNWESELKFETIPFAITGTVGYVWGWMTISCRSILLPVITHNLGNFLAHLMSMIK